MQTKNKANLALGISAAGFIGTMAAGGTGFLPGLLHHGFLAATIGGLADWFAVTAIFHKPLGISYRTDILRRNRPRIMDAIVTFASDDLLSTENIMRVIEEQDTARLLVEYLAYRGGRERVHEVVEAALLRGVADIDTAAVAAELSPAIHEGLQSFALEDVLADLLKIQPAAIVKKLFLQGVIPVLTHFKSASVCHKAGLLFQYTLPLSFPREEAVSVAFTCR